MDATRRLLKFSSIRSYFLISVFLISGTLIASGFFEIYYRYSENLGQIGHLQREVALGAAFKIEQFVQEIERTMRGATKNREIVLNGLTPEYKFELRKLLLIAPPVTEAVAVDQDGIPRAQVSRLQTILPGDRRDLSATPAFQRAKEGKSYFGPVYFVRGSEPYMTLAVPIERFAGEVAGVLQAEVNLKYIWEVISGVRVGKTGYAYAVTRAGDLVAHPDISLVLQRRNLAHLGQVRAALDGAPGPFDPQPNLSDQRVFAAYAPVRGLEWAVLVERPADEAFAPLYASVLRTAALLLAGLGMAVLASLLIGRRVVRPLEVLRRGAERIGSGDLGHQLKLKTGDEIEMVAEEFNKMSLALQEAHSGLEEKVEERTRELLDANQKLDEARSHLEEWNQTLEEKVQEQVGELERVSRVKRYLSPQIAEMILDEDGSDPFKTHRREVTVVSIDLRGFTNFSDSTEPEEVMQFLRSYHAEAGDLIFKYEGTVEHFAGDGIMVFFNDPVPREDHTEMAARMAVEVQARVQELRPGWHGKGYDLDVGIGMAAGYATLGTIGFKGRMDYGAIGNVTIMASRLSSEAQGGQILTDQRTLAKIGDLVESEPLGEVSLKGIARPVFTFKITKLKMGR